jgi:hypothetical protein
VWVPRILAEACFPLGLSYRAAAFLGFRFEFFSARSPLLIGDMDVRALDIPWASRT